MFRSLISKSGIIAFFVFALFLNLGIGGSFTQAANNYQVNDSLDFLANRQSLNDGGLIEIGEDQSNDLQTAWGVIAFSAADYDPKTIKSTSDSVSLLENLTDKACSFSSTTDIERTILALSSANYQLSEITECDLTAELESKIDPISGQIGSDIPSTIFGVLALSAEDKVLPTKTTDYLKDQQQSSGGWDSGWGTESNITAQAVMALLSAGIDKTDPAMINAKNYLKSLQTATGGIKYDNNFWTSEADAFSDSFVLQMIHALEESPEDDFWRTGEKTIIDDLMSLKKADNSFNFSQTWGALTPVWTTEIATIALSEKYLPVKSINLKNYPPLPNPEEPPVVPDQEPKEEATETEESVDLQNDIITQELSVKNEKQPLATDNIKKTTILQPKNNSDTEKSDITDNIDSLFASSSAEDFGEVQGAADKKGSINWFYLLLLGFSGLILGVGIVIYFYHKNG
jgi:hypothetical protein